MKNELRHLRRHMDETVLKDIDFSESAKENVRKAVREQAEVSLHRPWLYQFKNGLGVAVCCLLLFVGVLYAVNQQSSSNSAGSDSHLQGVQQSSSSSSNPHPMSAAKGKTKPHADAKMSANNSNTNMQTTVVSDKNSVHLVRIMDKGIGWKLTSSQILRTTNGGQTWNPVTPGKDLHFGNDAFFLSAGTAWVTGSHGKGKSKIYHTTDGGQHWTHTNQGIRGGGIFDFITSTDGWILQTGKGNTNKGAIIFHTTDGNHWNIVSETGQLGNLPKHGKITGLGFWSSNIGWATGYYPNRPGKVWLFRSNNGGQSWKPDILNVPSTLTGDLFKTFPPMFFKDNYLLPVVATNPKTGQKDILFYHKQSINSPWVERSDIKVANRKLTYDFVSGNVGWVTDGQTIFKTQDGGQHWNPMDPGSHFKTVMKNGAVPKELDIETSQVARLLAVHKGGGTVLLKTENGGQSWKTIN